MQSHQLFGTTLLAAAALLAAPLDAQCSPDGLDGLPCCAPVSANLPAFPNWSSQAMNICWTNCNPANVCSGVSLGAPTQVACGSYFAQFSLLDCGGTTPLSGLLTMDYTRTWEELSSLTPPTRVQVWRFAVKADLSLNAGAPIDPCMVPPCLTTLPTAFYYGYMDYAFDCGLNQWRSSLVLFHNCDEFIHDPLLTGVPGSFHPNRSYAIVAPHTTLNPFVPSILTPPVGPAVGNNRVGTIPGAVCTANEPTSGSMTFQGNGCGCTFALNPKQLTARRLTGTGLCGSSFFSLNLWPTYPWYHVMTTSIGTWTTAADYPGPERAWVDEGAFFFSEACDGVTYGEIYYGGSTARGCRSSFPPVRR